MGRLWDRYMGTVRADSGRAAIPTTELRAALLALNGTGVVFSVRETGGGGADLVADWKITEPATGSGPGRRQVERTFKVWMRLLPAEREVRAMDEQWAVTRAGSPPGRTVQREHGRGPIRRRHKEWTFERDAEGRRRKVESFRLDTRDLKDPLRNAVLAAGWSWHGVRTL
ncbi:MULTISPECIES: hypothetical protein [unclassified Streptomyces]|uniref:Uncharacterized protein n=1 Tax=Streptomyces sp. R33 TaxID=3238629 RepID=A0AB39Y6F6_9ACTN|nr:MULTISPECIES: hypothetical protein [unclassified Streptomyces]KJY36499.1 hypothetical protein VR46_30880 [Streptomyces sp. NRRL S-444]KOY53537.1 hypothetical protein ADK59_35120 [Streptomyces sp. XY332]TDU77618.1 hypothetical protein EDD91_4377 [Streptomyces sp. KS 21]THA37018.1 hypothetical protein E6W17_23630 [Streptomyces sp. A1547]